MLDDFVPAFDSIGPLDSADDAERVEVVEAMGVVSVRRNGRATYGTAQGQSLQACQCMVGILYYVNGARRSHSQVIPVQGTSSVGQLPRCL